MLELVKKAEQLWPETKVFAIDVANFVQSIPENRVCNYFAERIFGCGTGVVAYCRRAVYETTPYSFRGELAGAANSCQGVQYFLELLNEVHTADQVTIAKLSQRASELEKTIKTIIENSQNPKS